jgi:glycosyltransferase involved in cell wall biosynthesis
VSEPYFSVVTPTFNQGPFIDGCVRSVLAQGVDEFEHTVLDNCSTDGTQEVLRRFPHLVWISEPDSGQADALNKGFRRARGEVICWLNADDRYADGAFDCVRGMFRDPGCDVVFGDLQVIQSVSGERSVAKGCLTDREDMLLWWRRRAQLHQPAVFFRRRVFEEVGYLREDLHYTLDAEFWWRLSARYRFHYVDRVLATQYLHPECKSWRDWDGLIEERKRVFGNFYRQTHGVMGLGLRLERRTAMARMYLRLAGRFGPTDAPRAARMLARAAWLDPRLIAHRRWLATAAIQFRHALA